MQAIVLFGLIGLALGGIRGLFFGVALGFLVDWVMRQAMGSRIAQVQTQFLDFTFTVMGSLCKADGIVTRDEIAVAETIFTRLHLSGEHREAAKAAFNRGKAPDFDLDGEVRRFASVVHGNRPLLLTFLQIQCAAIAADGNVHRAEHEMLVRVARLLGLSERDVSQLEALLRTATGGAPSPQSKLDDAYTALGLSPSASDAQVKHAYRRLMSQNHPDKLTGKGLPESMREMAEERTREISIAYNLIKEARGFS